MLAVITLIVIAVVVMTAIAIAIAIVAKITLEEGFKYPW